MRERNNPYAYVEDDMLNSIIDDHKTLEGAINNYFTTNIGPDTPWSGNNVIAWYKDVKNLILGFGERKLNGVFTLEDVKPTFKSHIIKYCVTNNLPMGDIDVINKIR